MKLFVFLPKFLKSTLNIPFCYLSREIQSVSHGGTEGAPRAGWFSTKTRDLHKMFSFALTLHVKRFENIK